VSFDLSNLYGAGIWAGEVKLQSESHRETSEKSLLAHLVWVYVITVEEFHLSEVEHVLQGRTRLTSIIMGAEAAQGVSESERDVKVERRTEASPNETSIHHVKLLL
jgi:hypothetical protein